MTGGLKIPLIFSGLMLFNFMTNLGRNAQTYLLAGEVFRPRLVRRALVLQQPSPRLVRFATAFLFPILLVTIGTRWLLYVLIVASLLGAVVTWLFRIETMGVDLDHIGGATAIREVPEPSPEEHGIHVTALRFGQPLIGPIWLTGI